MANRLYILIGIALAAVSPVRGVSPPTHLTLDSDFDFLSVEQVRDYHDAALKGDASAALKLSNYYLDIENDIPDWAFWLRLAAELGDCRALGDFAKAVQHAPTLGKSAAPWKERFEQTCSPQATSSK